MLGAYNPVVDETYNAKDGVLRLENTAHAIHYSVANGSLHAKRWTENTGDGHTYTFEMSQNNDAKRDLDYRLKQAAESSVAATSSSTYSSYSGVHQRNLTTAQLDKWTGYVTGHISEASESQCKFKNSFEDGYAVVDVFAWDYHKGKTEHISTYRVDSHGYLDIRDYEFSGDWHEISKVYMKMDE